MRDRPAVDRADAGERILRAFDAGQDTAAIAVFLRADEAAVSEILLIELEDRRRGRRAVARRYPVLVLAWKTSDAHVDRHEIARRFGFRNARIAGSCISRWLRRQRERSHLAAEVHL